MLAGGNLTVNILERNILEKHFPTVEAGGNRRYSKDDIYKVLSFMKNNPGVQMRTIEEYSKISLGTLVSWRKKYGDYLGIKIKQYSNDGISEPSIQTKNNADPQSATSENTKSLQIPLTMIQELSKLFKDGSRAEFSLNNTRVTVDDQFLYVQI